MKNGTPISKQVVCLEPFLQTDWDMMWVTKLVSQKMSQMISECANQFVKKLVRTCWIKDYFGSHVKNFGKDYQFFEFHKSKKSATQKWQFCQKRSLSSTCAICVYFFFNQTNDFVYPKLAFLMPSKPWVNRKMQNLLSK